MVSPRFATCHISELTNPFLPLPPLQKANPHFQHAMFLSSPTCFSSSSPPGSESSFCDMPCFQAHQPAPPSSSPPASESPFCNMPRFRARQPAPPSSSPPASESLFCNMPHFRARQPAPPSSSSPASEFLFAMCRISELTNALLPPLQ